MYITLGETFETYLESLVFDELLDAINDEEEALLVAVAHVACVKPSVRVDGGSRRLRVLIVAQHHLNQRYTSMLLPFGYSILKRIVLFFSNAPI